MRSLLEVDDLSKAELLQILDRSEQADLGAVLAGKGAMLLFEKPSSRTRTSMEMAVVQLGGHPITLRNEEIGIDTRESAEDLGRLFSGYGSIIGARVFEHHKLQRLAASASVPVINLLSDEAHPVQALADLLTIRQAFGGFDDLSLAYVGDANNVAKSLGLACGLVGIEFRVSSPRGYRFDEATIAQFNNVGASLSLIEDPQQAVAGAQIVYTDAWYSMGQEDEQQIRTQAFAPWQVNEQLMSLAAPDAVFLHCLPAHRNDEVTEQVLDGPQSKVWTQAWNRMHTARGLMHWLLTEGAT